MYFSGIRGPENAGKTPLLFFSPECLALWGTLALRQQILWL